MKKFIKLTRRKIEILLLLLVLIFIVVKFKPVFDEKFGCTETNKKMGHGCGTVIIAPTGNTKIN